MAGKEWRLHQREKNEKAAPEKSGANDEQSQARWPADTQNRGWHSGEEQQEAERPWEVPYNTWIKAAAPALPCVLLERPEQWEGLHSKRQERQVSLLKWHISNRDFLWDKWKVDKIPSSPQRWIRGLAVDLLLGRKNSKISLSLHFNTDKHSLWNRMNVNVNSRNEGGRNIFFLNGWNVEVTEYSTPRLLFKCTASKRVHDDCSLWTSCHKFNTQKKKYSSTSDLNAETSIRTIQLFCGGNDNLTYLALADSGVILILCVQSFSVTNQRFLTTTLYYGKERIKSVYFIE